MAFLGASRLLWALFPPNQVPHILPVLMCSLRAGLVVGAVILQKGSLVPLVAWFLQGVVKDIEEGCWGL